MPCQMSLPIKVVLPAEVKEEVNKLNPRKDPGYFLISWQVLKKLPRNAVDLLTVIFNPMLSLSYFPIIWKYDEIVMIHKPAKPQHETTSYPPRSFFPVISKALEQFLLKRIYAGNEFLSRSGTQACSSQKKTTLSSNYYLLVKP